MTWTYDTGLTENRDRVRFLIGDTSQSNQLLQDEELDYALTSEGNLYAAAALAAESLSGQFSNSVDKSVGDLKLRFADRASRYSALAKVLRQRLLMNVGFATTGAESISSKDVDEADTDLVVPFFTRDMHESIPTLPRDPTS